MKEWEFLQSLLGALRLIYILKAPKSDCKNSHSFIYLFYAKHFEIRMTVLVLERDGTC
jgi:hypothetical protein